MGRNDWRMGLSQRGKALIEGCGRPHFFGEAKPTQVILADGDEATLVVPVLMSCGRCEPSGETYTGIYSEHPLYKYTMLCGSKVYCEKVQASPWSMGPCFFLALTDEEGQWIPETLWSEEEMKSKM